MPKNGNITGQVFDKEVVDQIEFRQKFLGSRYKTDPHLIYGNNVNSFLRLASSINVGTSPSPIEVQVSGSTVNDTAAQQAATSNLLQQGKDQLKVRGINQNLTGVELAKACVLFGGTVGVDDKLNPKFKFGIVDNGGSGAYDYVSTIAAYGWGGISSKGFVPMPTIESADISFYNRGALSKAKVNIKVYSVEQLQIFDILYFRIGYTMLLEWGHNIWLDNKRANDPTVTNPLKVRNEFVTKPFELFFNEGSTQQNIINAIHEQRANDSYNYDGMLGKVTNFNWKFNDDGSYDIELNLIGFGDIIESLKINKAPIITGKQELTPSQIAAKQDANRTAAYTALDNSETDAQKKLNNDKKTFETEVSKLNDKVKTFQPYIDSYTTELQDFVNEIDDTRLTARFNANQGNISKLQGIQFDTSSSSLQELQYNAQDAGRALDSIIQRAKEIGKYKGKFKDRLDYLKEAADEVSSVVDSKDLKNKSYDIAAQEEAFLKLQQDNDRKRRGLDAATQKAKKEEEIRSLSPITSVETKNKTLLNLQLYKWRLLADANNFSGVPTDYNNVAKEAFIKRLGEKNLYKLTLTANSANATATGTSKLNLDFYYVRLGFLLDWIQNNLLVYDPTKPFNPDAIGFKSSTKKSTDAVLGDQGLQVTNLSQQTLSLSNPIFTPTQSFPVPGSPQQPNTTTPPKQANPIFEIDTDPLKNICLSFPSQFSSDPKVCIIPSKYEYKYNSGEKGKEESTTIKWDVLSDLKEYFVKDNAYAGYLMNIYVNIDHAAGCVDSNTDANGKTSLLKFLSTLFNDINDVLGNVNKLEPVFDPETNKLKIIEGSSIDKIDDLINDAEKELNRMAVFQAYGIGTESIPQGSFIKNIDFNVQLPPNMAAMATISAQAKGNIVGENATGLSRLNDGFIDRLISVKLDKDSIEGAETGKLDPQKIFLNNLNVVSKNINSLYQDKVYAKDTIDSVRSSNRDIALYLTGNDALEQKMSPPFFIPFNLSLTMNGLSGMRNYERFSITEQILPYSYRSGNQGGVIDFLIKGISHTIKDNMWETKIESLSVGSNRKWSLNGLQNTSKQ